MAADFDGHEFARMLAAKLAADPDATERHAAAILGPLEVLGRVLAGEVDALRAELAELRQQVDALQQQTEPSRLTDGTQRPRPRVPAFRFALVTLDHEPAPMFFNTALAGWREGDEFLAGDELRLFRIVSILPLDDGDELSSELQAIWTVEPVCGR